MPHAIAGDRHVYTEDGYAKVVVRPNCKALH